MSTDYGKSYGANRPVPIGRHATIPATRDRSVPVRKVACPTCGALAGERCITTKGKATTSLHRERRRRALREGL